MGRSAGPPAHTGGTRSGGARRTPSPGVLPEVPGQATGSRGRARCARVFPACWRGTPARTSSRSPPATRWCRASARRWSTCSEPMRSTSSRPSPRWRSPARGCAGPRRATTSSPWSDATRTSAARARARPTRAGALLRRDHPRRASPPSWSSTGSGPVAMTVLGDLGSGTSRGVTGSAAGWDGRRPAPQRRRCRGRGPRARLVVAPVCPTRRTSTTASSPSATSAPRRSPDSRPCRVSCSGTSAQAPGRSGSSGCARTRRAARSPWSTTASGPRGSPATPAPWASPDSRSCTAAPPRPSPGCPRPTRSSSAVAPPREGVVTRASPPCRPGGRLVVHGVTLETEHAARPDRTPSTAAS